MKAILSVRGVVKYFPISMGFLGSKRYVRAVDGVDLDLYDGEVLALVGESGSGKTTLGRIIAGLLKPDRGNILYRGVDIYEGKGVRREIRNKIQAVFQNPDSSLNPRLQIFDILGEAILSREPGASKEEILDRAIKLLKMVGLVEDHVFKYPHELSGGERQRVAIARAIAMEPEILVADEIVSALDVSVRAQIMNLLMDLKEKLGLSIIFITHDMGLVWSISDRVAIMYLGKIVEIGPTEVIFKKPGHPYTKMLLHSSPILASTEAYKDPQYRARGEPPSPIDPPKGCRFITRCPIAVNDCSKEHPELREVSKDHMVACIRLTTDLLPAREGKGSPP